MWKPVFRNPISVRASQSKPNRKSRERLTLIRQISTGTSHMINSTDSPHFLDDFLVTISLLEINEDNYHVCPKITSGAHMSPEIGFCVRGSFLLSWALKPVQWESEEGMFIVYLLLKWISRSLVKSSQGVIFLLCVSLSSCKEQIWACMFVLSISFTHCFSSVSLDILSERKESFIGRTLCFYSFRWATFFLLLGGPEQLQLHWKSRKLQNSLIVLIRLCLPGRPRYMWLEPSQRYCRRGLMKSNESDLIQLIRWGCYFCCSGPVTFGFFDIQ